MTATLKTTIIQEPSSATANMTLGTTGGVTFGAAATTNTITSPAATNLTIQSAGTTAMTIDTSQNVGIGTSSFASSARLQVAGGRSYFGSNSSLYAICAAYNDTRAQSAQGYFLGATDSATPSLVFSNVDGTERMRIDSGGTVSIGTTQGGTGFGLLNVQRNASSSQSSLSIGDFNTVSNDVGIYLRTSTNAGISWFNGGYLAFYRGGPGVTESMRIDASGTLLIGLTASSTTTSQEISYTTAKNGTRYINPSSSFSAAIDFVANGAQVGRITTSGSATTYSTSSDYRLKNSVTPITTGLATVSALKPVTYRWNADDSDGEGFIAHELQEVVPLAVIGEKDAVNEDGSIKPQGVDYSKIVVHLVAAVQEQQATITALTTRISALEAS